MKYQALFSSTAQSKIIIMIIIKVSSAASLHGSLRVKLQKVSAFEKWLKNMEVL